MLAGSLGALLHGREGLSPSSSDGMLATATPVSKQGVCRGLSLPHRRLAAAV